MRFFDQFLQASALRTIFVCLPLLAQSQQLMHRLLLCRQGGLQGIQLRRHSTKTPIDVRQSWGYIDGGSLAVCLKCCPLHFQCCALGTQGSNRYRALTKCRLQGGRTAHCQDQRGVVDQSSREPIQTLPDIAQYDVCRDLSHLPTARYGDKAGDRQQDGKCRECQIPAE